MATYINNIFNFGRSLPSPFDTIVNKKIKVSSKYGDGTTSTLCGTVIKAVHAVCHCIDGSGEGAIGVIDHRTVAEYKSSVGPDAYHLVVYDKPNEICDYMCGSGTTKAAADKAGIRSHLYDLHSGFDIMNCDIPERPEFVFWHPPYWDIIKYSDVMYKASDVQQKYGYDPIPLDLSRIAKWDDFVKAMNYAMMKQFAALENGSRMAVLMGDIKKKGKLYSMLAEITKPGTLENIIIKAQHNCFSDRTQYSGKFIPILHEYVMIVRKDSPVLIPILMTQNSAVDIRDMPGATWRDVVAAVLEQCKEPVALSFLYEQIEPHKKAQANKWWKEKIRQTLQINPMHFTHDGRGMWSLNRNAA